MSFFSSCSCRLIVAVDTTTRSPFATAWQAAGIKYASDFPVPVPASTISRPSAFKAPITAAVIVSCSGRRSNAGNTSGWSAAERSAESTNSSVTAKGFPFGEIGSGGCVGCRWLPNVPDARTTATSEISRKNRREGQVVSASHWSTCPSTSGASAAHRSRSARNSIRAASASATARCRTSCAIPKRSQSAASP